METIVIPAPPVADLETRVAAFYTVPAVSLTIVGTLGHVYLDTCKK